MYIIHHPRDHVSFNTELISLDRIIAVSMLCFNLSYLTDLRNPPLLDMFFISRLRIICPVLEVELSRLKFAL